MRKPSLYIFASILLYLLFSYAGCNAKLCAPGKVEECPCAGISKASQTCKDDGSGWTSCSCEVITTDGGTADKGKADEGTQGGGGGITPFPTFISGQYRSTTSERSFVFSSSGAYQYYSNAKSYVEKAPELDARYSIVLGEILFERGDGSQFSTGAKLSENQSEFTWSEYPAEVFRVIQ